MNEEMINQVEEKEPVRKGFFSKMFSKARVRAFAMLMTLCSLLSISAFASSEVTVSSVLSEATPTLTTAVGSVWTLMTGNPVCKFALGCAVLAVGFRFLRKCIKVSHKA